MEKSQKPKPFVCFHEAGHAVAHYLNRVPMDWVTVEQTDEYLGCVAGNFADFNRKLDVGGISFSNSKKTGRYTFLSETEIYNLATKRIRCCLAGEIAQINYRRGSFRRVHSSQDWETVISIAMKISGSSKEAELLCQYQYERMKNELLQDWNWAAVETLANELMTRKTISGRTARKIIRAAIDAGL